MSALAYDIESNNEQPSVTTISVNARVDYILRFSKHAVLVVDEQAASYSQVGSQFLGALPNDHNAAFVAISPKFNDIQIRCRIIEQLFPDCLFDPEQSLAVSIFNLCKNKKQPIDIVVEHVQYLTLQLLHELCQLVKVAKKADYPIQVLLLGSMQSGTLVSTNKVLFDKKLSIISAKTGQLFSHSSKLFKVAKPFFQLTRFNIWLSIFIITIIICCAVVFSLYQRDVLTFSAKFGINMPDVSLDKIVAETANTSTVIAKEQLQNTPVQAQSQDIYLSLTAPVLSPKQAGAPVAADSKDIVDAIAAFQQSPASKSVAIKHEKRVDETVKVMPAKKVAQVIETVPAPQATNMIQLLTTKRNINFPSSPVENSSVENTTVEKRTVKNSSLYIRSVNTQEEYYLAAKTGFVIQLAGFTQTSVYRDMISDFAGTELKYYYRLLNEEPMLMLTSIIYPTRLAAEQAKAKLSSTISAHQPWLKSVEAINNEINAFQRSQ